MPMKFGVCMKKSNGQATYPVMPKVLTASLGLIREKVSQGFGSDGIKAFIKDHESFPSEAVVCMNQTTGQIWLLRNEKGEIQIWDKSKEN